MLTLIGLIALVATLATGCSASNILTGSADIRYEVGGTTDRVSLTYQNASGGTSQLDTALPWSLAFKADKGAFLYIAAQNQRNSGTVTVTILRNGKTFQTSTSSGAFVIASASGTNDSP